MWTIVCWFQVYDVWIWLLIKMLHEWVIDFDNFLFELIIGVSEMGIFDVIE